MKSLLQTHSTSFAESVKIALEAKGIDAVLLDEGAASYLSFAGRIRVAIANDADFDAAVKVVRALEPPPAPPLPSWRWHKRGLIGLGLGFLTIIGGAQVMGEPYARPMALVGGALFFGGIGLIAIGFRADRVRGEGRARGSDGSGK